MLLRDTGGYRGIHRDTRGPTKDTGDTDHKLGLEAAAKGQAHLDPLFPLTAIPRRIHRISSDLRS